MSDQQPAVVNPDLQAVHSALVHLVHELDDAIGNAKTSTEVIAITNEIADVNARVSAVGRQLLTQQTEAIKKASAKVLEQIPVIEEAVKQLDDIQRFIGSTTAFLRVIDEAVNVAKLVI